MGKIKKMLKSPNRLYRALGSKKWLNWMSDKKYLEYLYLIDTGKKIDWDSPRTYNEKLQWMKLNYRKEILNQLVDKYAVREFIIENIGEEYLIDLIGVYDSVDDINWEELPDKFVLKCTHGSGSNIICTNKNELDIEKSKKKLNKWMNKNWFWFGREWAYKDVKPRIICEEFLEQEESQELRDYRFFCFDGEPQFITVDFSITDKSKTRRNIYDLNWNLLDAEISYPRELDFSVEKPTELLKMIELSRVLSKNFPHVRVDFYYLNKRIVFGEMTFYHQSGVGKFRPYEFESQVNELFKLPNKSINRGEIVE